MSLEELVTGNLLSEEDEAGAEEELKPLLDLINHYVKIDDTQMISVLESLPDKIRNSPTEGPYLILQVALYMDRLHLSAPFSSRNTRMIATAATYATDHRSEEHIEAIEGWCNGAITNLKAQLYQKMERTAIGNTANRIDYLLEIFGDSLADELVDVTGAAKSTVKSWVKGGTNMRRANATKIQIMAKFFYALEWRQGKSKEESLAWYLSKWNNTGRTPKEAITTYYSSSSRTIRDMGREIGTIL